MDGDNDDSVFDRLWSLIAERFEWLAPIRIINRDETLTILDYRPTLMMFLTVVGIAVFGIAFLFLYFGFDTSWMWSLGAPMAFCIIFVFKGTLREVYHFDKKSDSYTFVRQFIYRKDVIEGASSQFTGASVKTVLNDESRSYFVVLQQEGMFLTGVSEHFLREEVPIFNSFDNEARIANAISGFLSTLKQSVRGSEEH